MDGQEDIDVKLKTEVTELYQEYGPQARIKSLRDCWDYEEPIPTSAKICKTSESTTGTDIIFDSNFICDICLGEFKDKVILKYHIKSVHNIVSQDLVPLKCTVCDFEDTSREHFERHLELHTGKNDSKSKLRSFKEDIHENHLGTHSFKIEQPDNTDKLSSDGETLPNITSVHDNLESLLDAPSSLPNDYNSLPENSNSLLKDSNNLSSDYNNLLKDTNSLPSDSNNLPSELNSLPNNSENLQDYSNGGWPYTCDSCGYKTANKKNMIRHFRIETGDKPYNCNHCNEDFSQACSLQIHSQKMHELHDITASVLQNKKLAKAPMIVEHKLEMPLECEICNKKFRKKISFRMHMRRGRHNMHKCSLCDYSSLTKLALFRHISRKHILGNPKKYHKCHLCHVAYTKKRYLIAHMKKHEDPIFLFKDQKLISKDKQCDFCDYKTTDNGSFTKHLRIHTGEKPYNCDYCHKKFVQSGGLHDHLRKYHNVDLRCTLCDFKTITEANLEKHALLHDEKRTFVCETCGRRYSTIRNLRKHLKCHKKLKKVRSNKKKVQKAYECDFCGYTSPKKKQLEYHIATHMEVNPFKCKFCKYTGVQKRDLTKHMTTKHSLVRKYRCEFCGFKTKWKYTLENHQLLQHSNVANSV